MRRGGVPEKSYSVRLNDSGSGRVAGSSWPAACSDLSGEGEIRKNSQLLKSAENKKDSENLNVAGQGAGFGKVGVNPNPSANHLFVQRGKKIRGRIAILIHIGGWVKLCSEITVQEVCMALSQISVRIDEDLKQRTDEAMKRIGTNPTQTITLLYQYIADNGKLPFSVRTVVSDKTEHTHYLLGQLRSVHEYCQILFMTNQDYKSKNSMELSMKVATHISRLHRELIYDHAGLSSDDVEDFVSILERLLKHTGKFIDITPGTHEGQGIQFQLSELSQDIRLIEQRHDIQK